MYTVTAWLARSAIVSVAEIKMGGDWLQPIDKANGKPIKGSSPGRVGSRTPSFANVCRSYPDPVEAVRYVNFGQIHRAQVRICLSSGFQDPPQRSSELHGLGRGQIHGVLVH
jgi:hypothetical protein